jgi:hypothetical protein
VFLPSRDDSVPNTLTVALRLVVSSSAHASRPGSRRRINGGYDMNAEGSLGRRCDAVSGGDIYPSPVRLSPSSPPPAPTENRDGLVEGSLGARPEKGSLRRIGTLGPSARKPDPGGGEERYET